MKLNKLSDRTVKTVTKPGRHSDGGGLYLNVTGGGGRSWVFMWTKEGRQREMGLGSLAAVSLASARARAAKARELIAEGGDPLEVRTVERKTMPTFGEIADRLVANMAPSWRNDKHADQWRMTLTTYAAPLRSKPVDTIGTEDVLAVVQPLWNSKPETASRLRGRIEKVMDAARALKHHPGPNPAAWKGNLASLLPARQKLTRGHHPAMPYPEVPAFVLRLRATGGISALALEFTILTAARSGEVLGARWPEIDLAAKTWTVPASRMKGKREHRVPLPDRALAILRAVATLRADDAADAAPVFPGMRPGAGLSVMALDMVLRRMKVADATVHGFRSSFRDWAGESTSFPREVAEAALAHQVGDETERAYRRGDALERRRGLMAAWAAFIEGDATDNVVALHGGRS
jgi:integrase